MLNGKCQTLKRSNFLEHLKKPRLSLSQLLILITGFAVCLAVSFSPQSEDLWRVTAVNSEPIGAEMMVYDGPSVRMPEYVVYLEKGDERKRVVTGAPAISPSEFRIPVVGNHIWLLSDSPKDAHDGYDYWFDVVYAATFTFRLHRICFGVIAGTLFAVIFDFIDRKIRRAKH
jgi:hypothetical protein